jgi:HK97 gp10 family phage protein
MTVAVRTNLPDFRRQMAALSDRIRRSVARRALSAAGRLLRDEAKRRAPVLKTTSKAAMSGQRQAGALQRSIYTGRSRRSRPDMPVQVVTVKARKATKRKAALDPFYWRFLEGGWMPRGRGQRIRGGARTRRLQRSRNASSGAKRVQYPFLKPAFDARGQDALRAFNSAFASGLADENRKLG